MSDEEPAQRWSTSLLPQLEPSEPSDSIPSEVKHVPSPVSHSIRRHPRSLRLRTGRGGRLHLDRLLQTREVHPLLRAERACWPPTSSIQDQRREEWKAMEEARWKNRDWRPENGFLPANLKKVADANGAGHRYWAHESSYGEDAVSSVGKRKRLDEEDKEVEVIGFEQVEKGLGLANDADWEKGPAEDSRWRREPRSSDGQPQEKIRKTTKEQRSLEEKADDSVDRPWRIDERWRYDLDMVRDDEDRFLLDDYQPK